MKHIFENPPRNCPLCPRLAGFREENRRKFPDKWNAPVPAFGGLDAKLLIVGLAPGLKGANFSGRPFTGDYAGIILYTALKKFGLAKGNYDARPDDGFELVNCRVSNAVRCVPPENKPLPEETKTCNRFLIDEINSMPNLKLILSLGSISHTAVLRTLGQKLSAFKFTHGKVHDIGKLQLLNTYHTSRYNMNTGTLTEAMFDDIIAQAKTIIGKK